MNRIEGAWLTRAKVFALPDGESLAAMSSAHMIADAGTRNIVLDELRDILDHGAPRAAPSVRLSRLFRWPSAGFWKAIRARC